MMRRFLDTLTSRRTSIALMTFGAIVGAIGTWVPQRANTSLVTFNEWRSANPSLAAVYGALGFDRVFSTWWFAAALAVFLVSLTIATWRMFSAAWRRFRPIPSLPRNPVPGASLPDIISRARAAGFRERSSAGDVHVLTRHRLGIWGPVVMHAGMVGAIFAAMVSSAFTSQAVIDLSAGEVFGPGGEYLVADGGVLSAPPDLGRPVRLDELTTRTWPTGELKTVTAHVSFEADDGSWAHHESTANDPLRVLGHTIYVQPGEFGDAAFLLARRAGGDEARLRMEFAFVREGEIGYSDIALAFATDAAGQVPVTLEGRWDPHGVRGKQPLALRLAGDEIGQPVTLAPGETVTLEDFEIEFLERGQWARLIVARSFAMGAVFAAFAIIGLGSLMIYAWIPRELSIAEEPGGIRYTWRVARMGHAYDAELERMLGTDGEENE